jgi:hypothetical protein
MPTPVGGHLHLLPGQAEILAEVFADSGHLPRLPGTEEVGTGRIRIERRYCGRQTATLSRGIDVPETQSAGPARSTTWSGS